MSAVHSSLDSNWICVPLQRIPHRHGIAVHNCVVSQGQCAKQEQHTIVDIRDSQQESHAHCLSYQPAHGHDQLDR